MFKPIDMYKFNLFILNDDLKKVTELIYDLKLVEFFDLKVDKFEKQQIDNSNDLSNKLLKIRSIITILKNFYEKDSSISKDYSFEEIIELNNTYSNLKKEIVFLKDEFRREKILKSLKLTKNDLNNGIVGFVEKNDSDFFKYLKENGIKFRAYTIKSRKYFFFNLNNSKSSKIKTIKDIKYPFKEFYIPKHFENNIEKKLKVEEKKLLKIESKLRDIANSSLKKFQIEELKLTKDLSVFEIRHKFANTKNISVLSGFIPKNEFKILKRNLEKELGTKFEIEKELIRDDAPIKLNNPSFINKFEALLKMYSLPKYNEFDPTFIMFLIFPLFFGFILGDVVYGLISLIFFTLLKFKFKDLGDFISILQISAISSIFFGFIFGEFMGFELHSKYYGFFSRAEDPQTLLIIAVIFGLIHINIGLIIGFINELQYDIKKAVYDKASWMIMELGVILLALGIYDNINIPTLIGILLFILGLFLIYLGHGFIGIIEVPSFFTNIFSYARLMAVGLSSIAIAVLVNDYSKILLTKGLFGIIFAVLLFSIGHIFNIVLGNFEGFIHTMRLHYVEFFTKFYSGGGKEFIPFGENIDRN